ncbi:MAG: formylglycine-generating enzyme family protein [Planctomycetaceae bacterium]
MRSMLLCCLLASVCHAADNSVKCDKAVQGKIVTAKAGPAVTVKPKLTPAQLAIGDPIVNSIGMLLLPIPAGEFRMGSPPSNSTAFHREKPQHVTRITRSFYLGMHEVTQSQYEKVTGMKPNFFAGAVRPAEQVSWYAAVEFCRQLSQRPRERAAGHVYRLPTEAEWEYACRAGTTTEFSFGGQRNSLSEYGWFDDNAGRTTHDVGLKKPNPWGLYDMHGNVWEWCHDRYAAYTPVVVTNPAGPLAGPFRVIRGGSWFFDAQRCGSAFRFRRDPHIALGRLGFRVLRCAAEHQAQDHVFRLQFDDRLREPETPHVAGKELPDRVHVQLTPAQREVSLPLVNTLGMTLIPIPAGQFQMGSADADVWGRKCEKPRHRVTMSRAFYLGASEVTQQQWQALMSTSPWKGKSHNRSDDNHPATSVSWDDAVRFCQKLSLREGALYRLPTEAEWEYACRAGTTTAFSFGQADLNLAEYGWFHLNALLRVQPVAQRIPNPWGLYDLHGNVWEWCSDGYAAGYRDRPVSDPRGPRSSQGADRVVRGGSWFSGARFCRSASRRRQAQTTANDSLGFRVVRVIGATTLVAPVPRR